jgi:ABC-type sugar transport system permease subunit
MIIVLWIPFLRGVWISFFEWPAGGESTWIGIQNYVDFVTSTNFITSLKFTAMMGLTTIPHLLIGLAAALAVYHSKRLTNFISAGYLIPFIIPPVASGTIIYYMLSPNFGPILPMLVDLGILDSTIFWRQRTVPAQTVVLGALTWTYWPWVFLILLAKRHSISDNLYESAKMYGANRFQMFRYITLPHMKGAILFIVLFRVIKNVMKTAQNWQLTRGGPGFETSPLSVALFRFAFENNQMGRAAAVGIIIVILTVIVVGPLMWWYERTVSEHEDQEVAA